MTVRGFFGGLLIAIGLLGAVLSGGCTLSFVMSSLSNFSLQNLGVFLLIGGIPFLISLLLIRVGKNMTKSQSDVPPHTSDEE